MSTVVAHYLASLTPVTLIAHLEIASILQITLAIFTYIVHHTQIDTQISLAIHRLDAFAPISHVGATVNHEVAFIIFTFLTYHTVLFHCFLYLLAHTIDTDEDNSLLSWIIMIFSAAARSVSAVIPRLSIIPDGKEIPECDDCAQRQAIASDNNIEEQLESRLRSLGAMQRAVDKEILAMLPPPPFNIVRQCKPPKKMRLSSPIQLTERPTTPSLISDDSGETPSPPSRANQTTTPSAAASEWQLVERGGRRGKAKRARVEATGRAQKTAK